MHDTPENDKSEYTDTGFRDGDARQGFGDDGGTRVGRPDGVGSNASGQQAAGGARPAPRDAQGGHQVPGQPGTNTTPVPDGIEGSEIGADDAQGQQQSRVQAAAEGITPGPVVGDDRTTFDL
ncbi:MAG TPA: hypothetical protein VGD56_02540 [Gemmatirosa sp.]